MQVLKYALLTVIGLVTFLEFVYLVRTASVLGFGYQIAAVVYYLTPLTFLVFQAIGSYGIYKQHLITSTIFSTFSVLIVIGVTLVSLYSFQQVYMIYVILALAVFAALMIAFTVMIREKNPFEDKVVLLKDYA